MDLNLLVVTLFISSIAQYGIQKVFIHFKRFDDFNHRSSHKTLATRTGGIGIFLTLLLVAVYHYLNQVELFDYSLFIPLGIMFVIGVYDDLYNADFKLKFFLQIIVAKILIDQGYVISNYHGLFGLYEVPWLIAQLSTIFVFLVVVNAINFIDGIDGLAITEVLKIILLIEFFSDRLTALAPLGLLVIVSLIPLYYFNFKKKRKVFLGDGGSMFLGTLVMIYVLFALGDNFNFKESVRLNKTLFVILVLLYPLFDLLRVFLIRIKNKKSPFIADQKHIHHILHKRKVHPLFNVIIIQVISLVLTLLIIQFL